MSPESVTKIALVAGEASGDKLGEGLIQSLKVRFPNAQFIGIGGPRMIAEGIDSWYPMEKLSVMGFFEVLKHLKELLKLRKDLINRLLDEKPDIFIGIDAPDFNFKVEGVLKQAGIKSIHYVGPSVWAWREKRLKKIKHQVDGMLVLFPFEPPLYDKYQIPVKFVGHPTANKVPETPDAKRAKAAFGLQQDAKVTGILPGSRMSEVNQMIEPYLLTAKSLSTTYPDMNFLIPCINDRIRHRVEEEVEQQGLQDLSVILVDQQAQTVMEASDQLLITSGTATLEAALMKRPMVLAIKVHPISYWIMKRLATTQWIGLPNILAQETLVTELIQADATVENMTSEMVKVIEDQSLRLKQVSAFEQQYLDLKQHASELAVDAIEDWLK